MLKKRWLRRRAERDLDERDVRKSSPLQHGAYFQPVLSINFTPPVFEKLYKYAEEPDDGIPIARNCKVRGRPEMKTNPDGFCN